MAVTFSKIMERTWRELGHLVDMIATGGSTTTVIVNSAENLYTSDDQLVGGTAIVTHDAGNSGAAPEGEYAVVSDYVAATKTWTIGAITTAIAVGDLVGLAKPKIRLAQMKHAVNDGLVNLGPISLVDTSLTTASNQTEYALPVGLKIKRLIDVLVQTNAESNNNYYESVIGLVRGFPDAPGSTGLLQFRDELESGYTLKIVYEGVHPELIAYNDVLSETIQEELAVAAAIDKALTWYVSKRGASALGTFELQRWNDAKQTLQMQKFDKPIYKTKKKPKYFVSNMFRS